MKNKYQEAELPGQKCFRKDLRLRLIIYGNDPKLNETSSPNLVVYFSSKIIKDGKN